MTGREELIGSIRREITGRYLPVAKKNNRMDITITESGSQVCMMISGDLDQAGAAEMKRRFQTRALHHAPVRRPGMLEGRRPVSHLFFSWPG